MRITTQCTPGRQFDYTLNACLENAMCRKTDPSSTSTIPITTTFTDESTTLSTTTSKISTTTIRKTTRPGRIVSRC